MLFLFVTFTSYKYVQDSYMIAFCHVVNWLCVFSGDYIVQTGTAFSCVGALVCQTFLSHQERAKGLYPVWGLIFTFLYHFLLWLNKEKKKGSIVFVIFLFNYNLYDCKTNFGRAYFFVPCTKNIILASLCPPDTAYILTFFYH